jgi:hypothetical protein
LLFFIVELSNLECVSIEVEVLDFHGFVCIGLLFEQGISEFIAVFLNFLVFDAKFN